MDLLRNLKPCKCMGPEGVHPSMLADVIVRSHPIHDLSKMVSKKIPNNFRQANVPPVFKM